MTVSACCQRVRFFALRNATRLQRTRTALQRRQPRHGVLRLQVREEDGHGVARQRLRALAPRAR
jgi:hypothetical protein